tara:strand:+ start:126640 stop:127494 length:855 start_codon:yes stop_codon:yes gene_type:complete
MKIIKKLLSFMLPAFKILKFLNASQRNDLTILTLHDIPREKLAEFEGFIDELDRDFNFITPEQCEDFFLKKVQLPKNSLFLTFDDGFKSTYVAWEKVLKPKGIKSAFFICSSFIDLPDENVHQYVSENLFMNGITVADVKNYQYPMSLKEIEELKGHGNKIGSHTKSHANLASLTTDEQRVNQIVDSKNELEALIKEKVDWIAYPFGAIENIDQESLKKISQHYSLCFSNVRGTNAPNTLPLTIKRQNIDIHSPLGDQLYIIWKGLDFLYRKKRKTLNEMAKSL